MRTTRISPQYLKLGEIAKLERQLEETKRSVVAEQRDVDGLAQLVDDPTNPRFARLPLKASPATPGWAIVSLEKKARWWR